MPGVFCVTFKKPEINECITSCNGDDEMCEYLMNGICFDPDKHKKGFVAQKCDKCPKQNFIEEPDAELEYIHPVFR